MELSLNCLILGQNTNKIFNILVGGISTINGVNTKFEDLTVANFKDDLFSRKELQGITEMNIWKVELEFNDIKNFSTEDGIKNHVNSKKMDDNPMLKLKRYYNNEDKVPKDECLHIFIVPITTDQELTNISHDITKFGYLPRKGGLGGTRLPFSTRVISTNEGVILTDPGISLRFDIIPPLIRDLMAKRIILIRAPPFAGKTSIAQILENSLVQSPEYSDYRVIRVSLIWGIAAGIKNCFESFGELWKEIIGIDWSEWIGQCRRVKTVLIVDEAQLIYKEERNIDEKDKQTADQFWTIVKGCLQELENIYIIMFAAYGYKSSNYTGLTIPVTLPEEHCKGLIDIKFTPGELKNYVIKFCNLYFNLDHQNILKFYAYIQEITEGHAGLVRHILKTTEDAMNKRIVTNSLTFDDIFKYLNSKRFNSSIYTNCRAVPKVSALSVSQKAICEEIYLNGEVGFVDSNNDMVHLVKTGILILNNNNNLTFAAPLLKRSFFQQNYGVQCSTDSTPNDLHHFIVKLFTAMCNELSGKILRGTFGSGSDGRILEQTWQKEFYRIGTQVLGRDHFLSCEVGARFGCGGFIDFYVSELDWAIEILRDGEDMAGHKKKFNPIEGEYKEIVHYAKSIAIIDIRSEAKKVKKLKEDFIHVSYSKNYNSFKIESLGKETVTINLRD